MSRVTKRKNSCHNCGSTDHYSKSFKKEKKRSMPFKKTQRKNLKERILSLTMVDAIRESSNGDQYPILEFFVEYQEETQLEIQDIQLEEGLLQDTANKNLCNHTQGAQTFLVTPTKGMA
ncbi:hypothetical protein O181_011550 [Austropuccinia psidii MF-1]|uniref:Uncharacterized protein n=1 Tax=Austropuccinia psidii MF-1 TaxID=1389203 RepID=A0A9Q3GM08_9BASI|nr:hypothetical protein [Austropuccinia psidii MF-1]